MPNSSNDPSNELTPESYPGYRNTAASTWMATRTAENQAAILLPYLKPGMQVLDCGCGPGTITVGLARKVAPGHCVGIDIDASQVELARAHASRQAVSTVRFEAATIYHLPFPDASFDAVYCSTVLGWLDDPQAALAEIYRVMRVGGVVCIRNGDLAGNLRTPTNPLLERFWARFDAMAKRRGANPNVGREIRARLRQAGFVNVIASATYESYGTEEEVRIWGRFWAEILQVESTVKIYNDLGSDDAEIERMRQAWQAWSEDPDAFAADVRCEALGWKV